MRAFVAPLLILTFAVLGAAQPPAETPKPAPAASPLETFVRHLMLWGPQITVTLSEPKPSPIPGFNEITATASYQQSSMEELLYVSSDGKKVIRGTVYDAEKSPFATQIETLAGTKAPSTGTPGAPVKIVVFSDFQCPYCKQEAKVRRDNILKEFPKEVEVVFKDLPIDQIHPWARPASIAGRCVFRQNAAAFWDYHDWIFEQQSSVTPETLKAKVSEWAAAKNLDMMQFNRCFDNREPEAEINAGVAEAQKLQVNSTPTMFVNGRMMTGAVPWPRLKAIIQLELEYAKRAAAGNECCSITLPTLAGK